MEQQGNSKLRQMGWGRARELVRQEFLQHPELREVYNKWVEDNQDELRTMNEKWRGINKSRSIFSRQIH